MHLTKFLSSILLVATASTSPLASQHASLSKRQIESQSQAGVFINAPQGVRFNVVHGAPRMPDLAHAASGTELSYWVGIDGIYDDSVPINQRIVIQAGFDAKKDSNGQVTYEAWYEWYPDFQKFVPDFSAVAGDIVDITVTIDPNLIYAAAAWRNRRTGMTASADFFSPNEDADAKGANAMWVIERNPGTTLANFAHVSFEGCFARGGGTTYSVEGATTIKLVDTGNTLAEGSVGGGNQVDIFYTGP